MPRETKTNKKNFGMILKHLRLKTKNLNYNTQKWGLLIKWFDYLKIFFASIQIENLSEQCILLHLFYKIKHWS